MENNKFEGVDRGDATPKAERWASSSSNSEVELTDAEKLEQVVRVHFRGVKKDEENEAKERAKKEAKELRRL